MGMYKASAPFLAFVVVIAVAGAVMGLVGLLLHPSSSLASSSSTAAVASAGSPEQSVSQDKCVKDIDTSLSVSGFGAVPTGVSMVGKNVLVVGGSRGIGLAAVLAFKTAGANVIGTSRAPSDPLYGTLLSNGLLDSVPLDITDEASVSNFFATSLTVSSWTRIDVLVLGGAVTNPGPLSFIKAADLFPLINLELLGRQRVVSHAIGRMKDVADSRIITLSSAAAISPIGLAGAYSPVKSALAMWAKQWNAERTIFKELTGTDVIKTRAIAFQATFVQTYYGLYPPSLCPANLLLNNSLTAALYPLIASYYSGAYNPALPPQSVYLDAMLQLFGNSLAAGMSATDAGRAILYMATVPNPNSQYVVLNPAGDAFCANKGVDNACYLRKILQHRDVDVQADAFIKASNLQAYSYDILALNNSHAYNYYKCPPSTAPRLAVAAPVMRADYPDCALGADPSPLAWNFNLQRNVDDLVNNACHAPLPCA